MPLKNLYLLYSSINFLIKLDEFSAITKQLNVKNHSLVLMSSLYIYIINAIKQHIYIYIYIYETALYIGNIY